MSSPTPADPAPADLNAPAPNQPAPPAQYMWDPLAQYKTIYNDYIWVTET